MIIRRSYVCTYTGDGIFAANLLLRLKPNNHVEPCHLSSVLPFAVGLAETTGGNDVLEVAFLGLGSQPTYMIASETINIGSDVYTASSGRVQNEPFSPGTYWLVGTALTNGVVGQNILVLTCFPKKLTLV